MVEILDCTIRDGSYVIDNQWTIDDVQGITGGLAACGIKYIEVGNGIGLGAHRRGVQSICCDEEYVTSAAAVKGFAKIGVFFIPNIGTLQDIQSFKACGGDFIRIGTDVSNSDVAKEYIEFARGLGLEVGYNFMKSYVVSPFELCKRAARIEEYGAQMISLVDSAGGMLPKDVGMYTSLLRECIQVRLGFHGHNNLLMANANSIAAIENGADMIDSTLMGMGRGAGNAQTETMLVILKKMGMDTGINPLEASMISQTYLKAKSKLLKGSDDLQLVMGDAQFHDTFLQIAMDVSEQNGIDFRTLILEVSKINKENPSHDLMHAVAISIRDDKPMNVFQPRFCHREVR